MYSLPHAIDTQIDQTLHALGPPFSRLRCAEIHPAAIAALTLADRPEVLPGRTLEDGIEEKPIAIPHPFVSWMRE